MTAYRDQLALLAELGISDPDVAPVAELVECLVRTGEPEAAAQALTSQEFQIATLLAAGRTTREAAAALFLSPKTVEYHLRHVYLKLAISSRRELPERLASDPELRARRGESAT